MPNDFELSRGQSVICDFCHTSYELIRKNEPICPSCLFGEGRWANASARARKWFCQLISENDLTVVQAFADLMWSFDFQLADILAIYDRMLEKPSEVMVHSLLYNLRLVAPTEEFIDQIQGIEDKLLWRFFSPSPKEELWGPSAEDQLEEDSPSMLKCKLCGVLTTAESSHCRGCKSPYFR